MQLTGLNEPKRIDYEYDLISGKVNFVRYQAKDRNYNKKDQFFYQYAYDAENRLTDAYSSTSAIINPAGKSTLLTETRRLDAHYEYYLHGPLARVELGDRYRKVQGMDYAYTLQGWLKGINTQDVQATGTTGDMGMDGISGTNAVTARDALGFSLGYYSGDYQPIGASAAGAFSYPYVPSAGEYSGQNLYNGNISSSTLSVRQAELGGGSITGYTYHYDQLNRLKLMRQHPGITGPWNKGSITQNYGENIT